MRLKHFVQDKVDEVVERYTAERPINKAFLRGMAKGCFLPAWKLMGKAGFAGYLVGYLVAGFTILNLSKEVKQ